MEHPDDASSVEIGGELATKMAGEFSRSFVVRSTARGAAFETRVVFSCRSSAAVGLQCGAISMLGWEVLRVSLVSPMAASLLASGVANNTSVRLRAAHAGLA